MSKKASDATAGAEWEKLVREQLDRILAAETFRQVDRLRRFLSFVVLESLAGRRDGLKEYVVGIQVFGKEASFDPRSDPVVRVQARRLRARLVKYYTEEGQGDEILIELPKGGYAPVFSRREAATVRRRSHSPSILDRNTACVAAFSDHSATGDLAYFCEGLRDEIIARLSALEKLRVLAWNGSQPGDRHPGEDAAAEAAVIVTGSIRTAGEKIRVTAHLLDGVTCSYFWSTSLDGSRAEMLEMHERVASAVAEKIGSQLVDVSAAGPRRPGAVNLAAHNLYLQGRYHLSQRTEDGLRKAVEFFEKALGEDAEYGRAHSGLSDAYALLAHYGVIGPAEAWTKVAATAASAVMLDPSSAEAHTSLAHAKATQDWDWHGAELGFRRAMSLDPRYATAPHWYSTTVLVPTGRLEEAVSRMLMAQTLDPVSAIIARDVATMYYYKGDFEAALERCDNAIELNPHFPPAYLTLALVQEQRAEFDESEAALERAVHLAPRSPRPLAALGRLFAITGRRRQASRALQELKALARERYVTPFELALLHFTLGQIDDSHQWLSRAVDDRSFELLSVRADPRCEALRNDPHLAPLIERVGVAAPPEAAAGRTQR